MIEIRMRKIGVILSFIQGLLIFAVYILNPNVILEQTGVLILVVLTFMAPSAIFSMEGRGGLFGYIAEGIYIGLIYLLFYMIGYNM